MEWMTKDNDTINLTYIQKPKVVEKGTSAKLSARKSARASKSALHGPFTL